MSLGFLGKDDLRQLTGVARQAEWRRHWGSIDWTALNDDEDEDGLEGLLILPSSEILEVDQEPEGLGYPVAGVYALLGPTGEINYIGQSADIYTRISQHYRAIWRRQRRPFVGYAYVEVCEFLIDAVEMAHIYGLRPPENRKFDIVRWEHHDEAMAILRAAWGRDDAQA